MKKGVGNQQARRRAGLAPEARTSFGRDVEARVSAALEARGYVVLERNARVGRDEVDVLAFEGTTLVLIEVRARSNASWQDAIATVRAGKVRRLKRAALALVARGDHGGDVRIDVVAVGIDGAEIVENAIDFSVT
ncbi:MAG: YraN family protein [Myxococcales bacterium]|nr:YraN family protein [Myxococcales bacterium]